MSNQKLGQMMWKSEDSGGRALYLKPQGSFQWKHYQSMPEYAVADPPNFSLGHATFVDLLRKGWTAVPG
jgi:hypothetical protein